MTWFAVVDRRTGALASVGSVIAERRESHAAAVARLSASGLDVVDLGDERPDQGAVQWEPATRSFVARPPQRVVDVVQEIAQDPDLSAVLAKLTADERQVLETVIVRHVPPDALVRDE